MLAAKKLRGKTNEVFPEINTIYQQHRKISQKKDTTIRETNEAIINFEDAFHSKVSNGKSLEQECLDHKTIAYNRQKLFEDIINNSDSELDTKSFYYVIGSFIGGLLFSYIILCFLTAVPMTIKNYLGAWWWEHPFHVPLVTCYILHDCSYWMNLRSIKTGKAFLILTIIGGIALGAILGILCLVWNLGGFYYPVPFFGIIGGYTIVFGQYLGLWLVFPKSWRKNESFRKRLIFFYLATTFSPVPVIEYAMIGAGLVYMNPDYQWIIAILLPILRHINTEILIKLASKAAAGDLKRVELPSSHQMNTRHALFLSYTIGSVGTLESMIIFLATDFLININITRKIIKVDKNNKKSIEEATNLLQELMVNEIVEVATPIMYLLCFVTAYYGPNADDIGNIKNSTWHFRAVQDLGQSVGLIFLFFLLDTISALTSSIWLWKKCRINLYRVFAAIQTEFGFNFVINFTCIFYFVSMEFLSYLKE